MRYLIALALLVAPLFGATGSANSGQQVTLSVASDGTAPLSYQWMKNGTVIVGATSQTYVIAAAQSTDAGNYTVKVSNPAGSVLSDTAILTVIAAPTRATVSVVVALAETGKQPTFQWYKNNYYIAGQTGPMLVGSMDPRSTYIVQAVYRP